LVSADAGAVSGTPKWHAGRHSLLRDGVTEFRRGVVARADGRRRRRPDCRLRVGEHHQGARSRRAARGGPALIL
jgi:hypothetical protein